MAKIVFIGFCAGLIQFYLQTLSANLISATPSTYLSFVNTLNPGDTLLLTPGTYNGNLAVNGRNGTSTQPIVIMGSENLYSTIFEADACCNTVSLVQCSYLIIKNLHLDGKNLAVDAVKAEGTAGNWAHHITIEYLNIVNYGNNQQNVGISTKCSAWDWLIRKNRIIGAGTGMYLGNSDGTRPFVNGTIEYNFIANTIGYNIEIKHQLDTVRDNFPGTDVSGKTMIRHNVFSKDSGASTGGSARPNLLVGGFPLNGSGVNDYYEIYGNFFYQNPNEALFQGTGNIIMYNNIFVNHYDPIGFRAVYLTNQNWVQPQNIKIFHNTIWASNTSGGIRLYNPNSNFQQYCYGNAVFSPAPITNFTDSSGNETDGYANAGNYVLSASTNINLLNMYPQNGTLSGAAIPSTLFQPYMAWNQDFNGDVFDWTFRGAYSGCCTNNGWHLQLDTMASPSPVTNSQIAKTEFGFSVFPNPFSDLITISTTETYSAKIELFNTLGQSVFICSIQNPVSRLDLSILPRGIYFIEFRSENEKNIKKIIKEQ